jgi:EAL domain-containing protein (putative c-di-GMP-specific phosphodiesterase class I)
MGKSQVCTFAEDMRADVVDRMRLEADLRAAIEAGDLTLDYQPIVDLSTGRAAAVEAFVRWNHPQRGPISPAIIVPLAEETGLIRPLGDWVLRAACLQVAAWRKTLEPALSLAINLSPRQVADRDLVRNIQATAGVAGLPVGSLMIEITEAALLADDTQTVTNLEELRSLGAWVAIDDFGTGYSSLSALGRLPVDILKIDPVFTAHLDRDDDRKLASLVLGLGQTLGLRVVAEGIEREDQLVAIRALGCPMGQGYLLAEPLPPARLEARFRAERPRGVDGAPVRLVFGHPELA